jgi:hypothetical protein
MRIDENTLAQARAADMVAFLEKYHGFTFAHRGGEYRCNQHKSLAVKSDRLSWFWHSKSIGGYGALDYLTKVENMPFREAEEWLQAQRRPPHHGGRTSHHHRQKSLYYPTRQVCR